MRRLEKGVKCVQNSQWRHQNCVIEDVLVYFSNKLHFCFKMCVIAKEHFQGSKKENLFQKVQKIVKDISAVKCKDVAGLQHQYYLK